MRKKADREQLVGRDCQDCAGWYAALKTLGIGGLADTRPACGHAVNGGLCGRMKSHISQQSTQPAQYMQCVVREKRQWHDAGSKRTSVHQFRTKA